MSSGAHLKMDLRITQPQIGNDSLHEVHLLATSDCGTIPGVFDTRKRTLVFLLGREVAPIACNGLLPDGWVERIRHGSPQLLKDNVQRCHEAARRRPQQPSWQIHDPAP